MSIAVAESGVTWPAMAAAARSPDRIEQFYYSALQNSASGIIIVGCTGEILHINPAARVVLHKPRAKCGDPYYSLFADDPTFDGITDVVFQGLSSPEPTYAREVTFRHGHELIYVDVKAAKLRDEAGRLVGVVVTINDVTHQHMRVALASVFASGVSVVFFYVSLLGFFSQLVRTTEARTLMNSLMMLLPAAGSVYIATQTGLPIDLLGLSWKNGWRFAREAALLSLTICAGLTVLLYIGHLLVPALHGLPVFLLSAEDLSSASFVLGVLLYIALTPLQEFLARGTLQAPLEQVFTGNYRHWAANIIANLLFSVFHDHLGVDFAIMVLGPGLFWGWLFSRQKTLVGVSVSHAIIGTYGLVVLNLRGYVGVLF